ncbi:MAG: hypothetical protein ACI8XB_002450, partial [Patiriisocius sp.]
NSMYFDVEQLIMRTRSSSMLSYQMTKRILIPWPFPTVLLK